MSAPQPEPLVDGLFRSEPDGTVTLLGGRSASTGSSHFPRRTVCPYTGADDVEPVDLPRSGTLWAWTTVTVAPPGYTGAVPYCLGVVQLDDGLRVVGRMWPGVVGSLTHGERMHVVADTVPDADGTPRSVWAFAPQPAPADG